jgi:hypothetical protein
MPALNQNLLIAGKDKGQQWFGVYHRSIFPESEAGGQGGEAAAAGDVVDEACIKRLVEVGAIEGEALVGDAGVLAVVQRLDRL